jgi:trehalose synthase
MAFEVDVSTMSIERFRSILPPDRYAAFERAVETGRELLDARVVWNVNSTARGGGVVELLQPLLGYARGAGVDARWVVIEGPPEFFAVTKRIHNLLHGMEGDGGRLDDAARRVYEDVLARNAEELAGRVCEGDVVIVHDPQPAGLVDTFRAAGAAVVWRCHVGLDHPNERARAAWAFLRPYVEHADAFIFSRASFAWEGLDRDRIVVIPPSIDAFAPKNQDLDADTVRAVLHAGGVLAGRSSRPATFERRDGTRGRVERQARIVQERPLTPDDAIVLQVSRWDRLKDPHGVIEGFARHINPDLGAHLVYAGPAVEAVADDPEGAAVLQEAIELRAALPGPVRALVHLATLPMQDAEENAIIVNALQRHARVVVQKSLAEGFGLTVAEAMWKSRPVVASRIGGIQDQIVHGESGLLLDDPRDLAGFGEAVTSLLTDRARAERLGERARERVRDHFLSTRSLLDYLAVIQRVLSRQPVRAGAG